MEVLTIPATMTIHTADKQTDSRYKTATLNIVHEGTYYGKYLFSCAVCDAAAPTFQNVTIAAEDNNCALGVIPEGSVPTWALVLEGGKWQKYLQTDCLLWVRTSPNADDYGDFEGKSLALEAELSITGSEDGNICTVQSFTVNELRLISNTVKQRNFTIMNDRYGALPERKGGVRYGR